MFNSRIPAVAALLLACSPAQADLSLKAFRQLAQTPDSHAVETYLIGLTEGLMWSDTFHAYNKSPRLFCLPPNLPLTADTAKALILNSDLKGAMDPASLPVAPILVKELQAAFPCKP